MGVVPSAKSTAANAVSTKRRSGQLDLSNLGPLKTTGTVGFSAFRDQEAESAKRRKSKNKSNGAPGAMDEDSDDDDDEPQILGEMDDVDEKDVKSSDAPEDAKFTGELAEGVDRIKVQYQFISSFFLSFLITCGLQILTHLFQRIAQASAVRRTRGSVYAHGSQVSQPRRQRCQFTTRVCWIRWSRQHTGTVC